MPIVSSYARGIEMSENAKQQARNVLANLPTLLPDLESVYKDIHSHPELSMQEKRTAAIAADRLRSAGYAVTASVGKTGVVGILRNGEGPTIMLRADMDALPVRETTGVNAGAILDRVTPRRRGDAAEEN